ncbi:MAG: response regulator transcription factor [Ferruginibacter sp.]
MDKILLVDDHTIIRTGLKILLGSDLIGYSFDDAENGDTALAYVKKNDYALLMLDVNIPGTDTFELAAQLLLLKPALRILVFSMNEENVYAKKFLKMGAKGYVRKDAPAEDIKKAVSTVLNNRRYISKAFSEILADSMFDKKSDNPFDLLSPKQFKINQYLLQGKSISEICSLMSLHSSTVSTQKNRIFEKLKVTCLVELYAMAKMHELVAA